MKIRRPNAVLVARHDWAENLATFTVRPDGWELPDFHPGQFSNLALPAGDDWDEETGASIRRAYSIASTPGKDTMEFFIRRVDEGALTPKLFDLPIGGRLYLEQKVAGHFTIESAADAEDLVLVGTGTGIAPYWPIMQDRSLRARFGRTILLYSDRYVKDLGYIDEFRALEQDEPNFLFFPTITGPEPEEAWGGLRGRVNKHLVPDVYEALTGKPLTPERCQVFLCGNPQMIVDVQSTLEPFGFKKNRKRDPGQLHMEKYW